LGVGGRAPRPRRAAAHAGRRREALPPRGRPPRLRRRGDARDREARTSGRPRARRQHAAGGAREAGAAPPDADGRGGPAEAALRSELGPPVRARPACHERGGVPPMIVEACPDPKTLAEAAADRIARAAALAIAARGRFTIALSGGSTPRPTFERLAVRPVDWSKVVVVWGDERCVPPD